MCSFKLSNPFIGRWILNGCQGLYCLLAEKKIGLRGIPTISFLYIFIVKVNSAAVLHHTKDCYLNPAWCEWTLNL